MPAEVMVASAIIVCVFVLFGAVLYWGERRTRGLSAAVETEPAKRRAF
jgi:hypothetical protein